MANPITQLWPPPPARPQLGPGQVHVWSALLDQPPCVRAALGAALSPDEQRRASQFHFVQGQHHYLCARGLLRHILASYLEVDPARLLFVYGPQGKPALQAPAPLQFNLSHSEGLVLVAVSRDREVGVDLERSRWLGEADDIVRRFFWPDEKAAYQSAPGAEKEPAFFRLWTGQEARLKCAGLGIGQLENQNVAPEIHRLTTQEIFPAAGFAAAVAAAGRPCHLHAWQWPLG